MNCDNGICMSRGFPTREERIDSLKRYKEALDNESKGVAERIAELSETDEDDA
ncbi:MAG: hypothetical protein AABX83_03150 [Nanoarchaeota archaeon]